MKSKNEVFPDWDNANIDLEKIYDSTFIYPMFSKTRGHISINLFFVDKRKTNIIIPKKYKQEFQKILVALTHEIIQKVGLNVIAMAYKEEKLTMDIKEMMARDAISRIEKYSKDHNLKNMIARKYRKKLGLQIIEEKRYNIRFGWEEIDNG